MGFILTSWDRDFVVSEMFLAFKLAQLFRSCESGKSLSLANRLWMIAVARPRRLCGLVSQKRVSCQPRGKPHGPLGLTV